MRVTSPEQRKLIANWRIGIAKWQLWDLWLPPLPPTSALLLNLACLNSYPQIFLSSTPLLDAAHDFQISSPCPALGLWTPPHPAPSSSDAQHGLKFHRITLWGKEDSQDSSWSPPLPLRGGKRARVSRVGHLGWRVSWGQGVGGWHSAPGTWEYPHGPACPCGSYYLGGVQRSGHLQEMGVDRV